MDLARAGAEPLNGQFKIAANGVTTCFGLGQYPMKNAFIALPSDWKRSDGSMFSWMKRRHKSTGSIRQDMG